jgi:hydroxymethylglutaryl-CoA lyase
VVVDLARRAAELGVARVALADSAGLANPRQVGELVRSVAGAVPATELALHLHDTRGLGLVNAWSGMEAGIDVLDSALGGLGGCPISAGATGNIATEDLVNLCEEAGVRTGVDTVAVRAASRRIASFLGRQLPSRVLAVGTRSELFARTASAADRLTE